MKKWREFACTHGHWSKRQCELIRAWALEYLDAPPDELVSYIVYALDWRYHAHVVGIPADMWAMVRVETYDKNEDGKPVFKTNIQCDRIEDGLAFTLRAFYEEFGEERRIGEG